MQFRFRFLREPYIVECMKQSEKEAFLDRIRPQLVVIPGSRPGKTSEYCHEWKAGKLPIGWKFCFWCKIIRHTENGTHTYYRRER